MADGSGPCNKKCAEARGRQRTGVLPTVPRAEPAAHCAQEASHCCWMCRWSQPAGGLRENLAVLFCLLKNRRDSGALWSTPGRGRAVACGGESGALIFRVFNRNPRLGQLLPGQGVLYSGEFFLVGVFPITRGSHCKYMCIYK